MNLRSVLCREVMWLFGFLPIKKNKIVFISYYGKYYNDSPRYIFEAIAKKGGNIDCVWLLNDSQKKIGDARVVKKGSIRSLYELATAKVWVDNCRKPLWTRKRKKQFYLQTWHSGIGNKAAEKLAQDKLTHEYIKSAIHDSNMADLFISNSKWLTKIYKEYFWYHGEILEQGLPRDDSLYRKKDGYYKKVCKFYNIDDDTNLLLYAPTVRDDGDIRCYDMDYLSVIEYLKNITNKKWKMIIRLHPNIKDSKIDDLYGKEILNGSKYDEINDLILASQYVISDYSSCLFDALLADKITLIYASDFEHYKKKRGFIFKWDITPFPIATSTTELLKLLENFDVTKYNDKRIKFLNNLGLVRNTRAAETVANRIITSLNQ